MCLLTVVELPSSGEMLVARDSFVVGSDSFQVDVTFYGQRNLMA